MNEAHLVTFTIIENQPTVKIIWLDGYSLL